MAVKKADTEAPEERDPSAATIRAAAQAFKAAETARKRADALLAKAHEDGWSFRELGRQCGASHTSIRSRVSTFSGREDFEDEGDA